MRLKRFPKTRREKLEDDILSGGLVIEPIPKEEIEKAKKRAKEYLNETKS